MIRRPPWFERLSVRYDALTLRERGLVGTAILALVIATWQLLLMDPLDHERERLQSELRGLRAQIDAQDEQGRALARRYAADPDAELRQRLARLDSQHAELDAELAGHMSGLIEPAQMARVLEDVLTRQSGLELVAVRSLPPEPLLEAEAGQGTPASQGVFRHGVDLEFTGTYLRTVEYLRALQALPWAVYWDGVTLDVEEHPRARVSIRVYTLGLREGWIGV